MDFGGKNLFDKDNANILNNIYIGSSALGVSSGGKTLYIECQPNTTYTVSKIKSARFSICSTDVTPAQTVAISNRHQDNNATSLQITTGSTSKYLCVFYYLASADTVTEQSILDSLQIEKRKCSNRVQSLCI